MRICVKNHRVAGGFVNRRQRHHATRGMGMGQYLIIADDDNHRALIVGPCSFTVLLEVTTKVYSVI